MQTAIKLTDSLLGLAFPEVCQVCDASHADANDGFVCRKCLARVFPTSPPWCEKCGLPFEEAPSQAITCGNCHEADWNFNRARSMMAARGLVREVIHRFKYNRHEFFEPLMIQWLQGCKSLFPESPECVIPIPLHPLKERDRGFNQARRLADGVAAHMRLPLETGRLRRVIYTQTQTNLSRKERLVNMQGAFEANKPRPFTRVLLVDDVMTTGATASAGAMALQRAGVKQVDILTLARGLPV